jgi:hypothetical protein
MSLDLLERLEVPVFHPFFRPAVIAWWYIPSKHEKEYFQILELLWTHVVTPRLASVVCAYFRLMVPPRDYPAFRQELLCMLGSLL